MKHAITAKIANVNHVALAAKAALASIVIAAKIADALQKRNAVKIVFVNKNEFKIVCCFMQECY